LEKLVIWLLMLSMFIPVAVAFDCYAPVSDYLPGEKLDYVCYDITSAECYAYIAQSATPENIIEAMPQTLFSKDGFENGYTVENNHSIVSIETGRIKTGLEYTISIVCGTDTKRYNQTLSYSSPASFRGWEWAFNNRIALIWTFFILLIIVIVLGLYWKQTRGQ